MLRASSGSFLFHFHVLFEQFVNLSHINCKPLASMQVPSYTANDQTFNLSILLVFDHFVKADSVRECYRKTTDHTSRYNVIFIYS